MSDDDRREAPAPAPDSPRGPAMPPGRFLGIETTGRIGSVALSVDGAVTAQRFLTTRSAHASGLVPAVQAVLADTGTSREELEGVVVGAGPGSFTGVRIGAAAAKGLASGLRVPLYATSSLRAAAFAVEALEPGAVADVLPPEIVGAGAETPARGSGPQEASLVHGSAPGSASVLAKPLRGTRREVRYVLFDARGGRVYGACYDVGVDGPCEVVAPHGGTIVEVINRRPPVGTVFMGDGAAAHARLLEAAGFVVAPSPAGVPLAGTVLRCCSWTPVDVCSWEPDYVREWRPG